MADLYELENVSLAYYDRITALDSIHLGVRRGEMLSIIGSNGSGKSSLLMSMAGLLFPSSGIIRFDGVELTGKTLKNRSYAATFRSRVGILFQNSDSQLFCSTVRDDLLFGPLQMGLSHDEATERIGQVSSMLGISSLLDRPPSMLSGGEKKRVALGTILANNPEVLLLDEPTSGLDPKSVAFLMELAYDLVDAGKTVIMATHDLSLVEDLEPRVAVLSEDHRLIRTGSAQEILRDTELLIKVNLIHEHIHRHGGRLHSHPHGHYGGKGHGH